MIDTALKKLQK